MGGLDAVVILRYRLLRRRRRELNRRWTVYIEDWRHSTSAELIYAIRRAPGGLRLYEPANIKLPTELN